MPKCLICNKPFIKHTNKKYCSQECYNRAFNKLQYQQKICPICHKKFITTRSNKKFCSKKCCNESFRPQKFKKCPVCKNEFLVTKIHKKHCSKQCSLKDPTKRLIQNLRNRLYFSLKGKTKFSTTLELVGCSIEELWQHLESQFQPGMTKENYGKWHVDHKIPCASFDLSESTQQKQCFHYTNLQPLWAEDNFKKGKKPQLVNHIY